MASDEALTIIVPIKGRPAYTFRWLSYMNESKCPYRIIIADGGDDVHAEKNLRNTQLFPNLRYRYVRFPYDADYAHYYKKFHDSLGLVKTPYTLFADNDDFILNDSLAESIRFLDAHQDYASCGGRPVLLHLRKRSPSTPTEMLTGNRIHLRQAPQGRNNVAESAHERIRHGLEYYYDYGWYNVHRTQALVPIFREAIRINFDRIFFLEHLLSAGIAKFGKASYDAPAHWVRQEGTSMGTGSSVQEQDDIILASLLPFWGANVAELVGSIVALAEPLNPVDRADFEISVRRMLARIIRTMYAYSLAPSPAYKRVLDRMGIRDTTLWRGLRQCAIKSVEAYTYHDLLFTQRLQTREILRRQPEVGNVLRFLGGSACEWLRLAASGECKP